MRLENVCCWLEKWYFNVTGFCGAVQVGCHVSQVLRRCLMCRQNVSETSFTVFGDIDQVMLFKGMNSGTVL